MSATNQHSQSTFWGRRSAVIALVIGVSGAATACDGLLEVDLPGSVTADILDDPRMATTMFYGAIGELECAFDQYVSRTAVISGEIEHSSGLVEHSTWGRRAINDRHGGYANSNCGSNSALFTPLQTARFVSKDLQDRIENDWPVDAVEERTYRLAMLAALEGYALQLLGEGFCEMAVDGGPLLSREDVWEMAEDRFSKSLQHAQAAGVDSVASLAYVGRARARLNLGKFPEAAADARQVPEGFKWWATRGDEEGRRNNRIWINVNNGWNYSVHPDYHNLDWAGVPDPRVDVYYSGNDRGVPPEPNSIAMWWQNKYPQRTSPLVLAGWEEAQLILAEAEGGQTALDVINRLHTLAGLPPFVSDDTDEIMDHLIQEERRRQLFLEGHRLNDLLRHDLPFPPGPDWRGLAYHDPGTTCFPLPFGERTGNPNIGN